MNKTCDFICHMDVVDAVFGRPRIVYVVRDGRDVALSLLQVKAWGPRSVYGAARRWRDAVESFRHHAAAHLQGRLLQIRYEDLLADPETVFADIARFYGIYDPERHARLVESIEIKRGNQQKWRTRFTADELRLFERVAGDALLAHGYQLGAEGPRLPPFSPIVDAFLRAREALGSRLAPYPLWFRGLRVVNRVIGRFPGLQERFFRTEVFARHFNWNQVLARREERAQGRQGDQHDPGDQPRTARSSMWPAWLRR